MNSTREAQFNALLALVAGTTLNGATGLAFVTASRRFQSWDEIPDASTPAVFLTKGFEYASQDRSRGETKWRVKALLWIYCLHSPDSDTIPGELLNNLLDGVETRLKPPVYDDRQTLGGLVDHCYIDGDVIVSEGSLPNDRISIAIVPVILETGV